MLRAGKVGLKCKYHFGDKSKPATEVTVWVILCALATDLREVLLGVKPGSKREDILTLTSSDHYYLIGTTGKYSTRVMKDKKTRKEMVLSSVTMANAELRTEEAYLEAIAKTNSVIYETCASGLRISSSPVE